MNQESILFVEFRTLETLFLKTSWSRNFCAVEFYHNQNIHSFFKNILESEIFRSGIFAPLNFTKIKKVIRFLKNIFVSEIFGCGIFEPMNLPKQKSSFISWY